MEVSITRESPILVKAVVNLPWEKVLPSYKETLKEIGNLAQVPGFRKGKAPAALLKKRFRQQIIGEMAQKLIPDSIDSWVKENHLRAVGAPRLHHVDLKEQEHFHYHAELDVLPEIELKEWRGSEAESLNVKVTPEMIDNALKHRQEHASKREAVVDRPVAKGDTVTLHLSAIDLATEEHLTDLEDYRMTLGEEQAHPLLQKLVPDMELEDFRTEIWDAPEDDSFENWRGRRVKVFVELMGAEKVETPEIDDEFAKNQGAKDLADLKKIVASEVLEQAENQEKHSTQNRLISKIMKDYDFEVPQSLVMAEAENITEQQIMPYMQHLPDPQGKQAKQMIQELMRMNVPQAMAKVRADLVLEKIADSLEITIDDAELDKNLEPMLGYFKGTLEELKERLEKNDRLEPLRDSMRREKALEKVFEEAKIKKVDELSEEKQEKAEDEAPPAPEKAESEPDKPQKAKAASKTKSKKAAEPEAEKKTESESVTEPKAEPKTKKAPKKTKAASDAEPKKSVEAKKAKPKKTKAEKS